MVSQAKLQDEIKTIEEKIDNLKQTLLLMPDDTFLGRVCITGYIKKYTKELCELKKKVKSLT